MIQNSYKSNGKADTEQQRTDWWIIAEDRQEQEREEEWRGEGTSSLIQAKVRAFQKDTIFNVRAPSRQGYGNGIGFVVFISQRPSFPLTKPSKMALPIKKSTLRIPFMASA